MIFVLSCEVHPPAEGDKIAREEKKSYTLKLRRFYPLRRRFCIRNIRRKGQR
jgi:hypothetical protein